VIETNKAKEKAERYLNEIVDKSLDNIVNSENYEEIPEGWPLQLEAYIYLGHKYKNLTNDLSTKVRNLWLNWADFYERKTQRYGRYNFFWPTCEEFTIMVSHEDFDTDVGHWIECHMAMFRAKENLNIVGFNKYFNEAKRRLGSLLIEFDVFTNYRKNRILWQIARSPNLCMMLQDYLGTVSNRLLEEERLRKICDLERKDFKNNIHFLIRASFFLVLFNEKDEFINISKKILVRLADEQERNGSFLNDIISTCIAISALNISNIDSSGIISDKAIKWLLNEQKDEGYWKARGPSWSYDLPEFDVLSTVFVLETIDIITNNKVLPIWAEGSTISEPVIQKRKYSRIKPIHPFKTPAGVNWHDITIRFISEEVVQIRAGSASEGRDFKQMGFEFRDLKRPDILWEALKEFGKHQGEISFYDGNLNSKIKKNLKYNVYALKIRLRVLFGIKNNPFYPFDRKKGSYRTKFNIRFDV